MAVTGLWDKDWNIGYSPDAVDKEEGLDFMTLLGLGQTVKGTADKIATKKVAGTKVYIE